VAETALRAIGIGFDAGRRSLVAGVSLDVRAGELLGIIGPNGAGKSTLLRMLAGLLRPSNGQVLLQGRDIAAWPGRERARHLGYLPQHFQPHWDYTVRELLHLGLERGGATEGAAVLAARHGLEALLSRRWSSISGGERGRALAAAVLAPDPAVILADEASAALDVGQALTLMTRLRSAARAGAAVALVAHDLNLAFGVCDRIALLSEGCLLAYGTPAELVGNRQLDAAFGVTFGRWDGPEGVCLVRARMEHDEGPAVTAVRGPR